MKEILNRKQLKEQRKHVNTLTWVSLTASALYIALGILLTPLFYIFAMVFFYGAIAGKIETRYWDTMDRLDKSRK